MKNPAPRP